MMELLAWCDPIRDAGSFFIYYTLVDHLNFALFVMEPEVIFKFFIFFWFIVDFTCVVCQS